MQTECSLHSQINLWKKYDHRFIFFWSYAVEEVDIFYQSLILWSNFQLWPTMCQYKWAINSITEWARHKAGRWQFWKIFNFGILYKFKNVVNGNKYWFFAENDRNFQKKEITQKIKWIAENIWRMNKACIFHYYGIFYIQFDLYIIPPL